eukprot:CAMPEP_0116884242 /NCGR_PEP_ID=MMETSP0463-20121206/17073_1 /TAXON_ID=181622 /ORGANISM="Strombidinopsis sp, Strain SopsisLIS2011" /LENGTH=52 /DNA_ID=CAMNT_0004540429 /DNA_START=49 /DNA_END=207 /DNA_ORIENTATION=+
MPTNPVPTVIEILAKMSEEAKKSRDEECARLQDPLCSADQVEEYNQLKFEKE